MQGVGSGNSSRRCKDIIMNSKGPDIMKLPDGDIMSAEAGETCDICKSGEKRVKGRFAPSPTGRMHIGNICAALLSWHSAKSRGGDWLLRIEDLDPQRSRREYAEQIEDDLHRLGLDWDEGGLASGYVQSERGDFYEEALAKLKDSGLVYPCVCTRADIMATQAPHQSDGRIVYSGNCRPSGWGEMKNGIMMGGREIPMDFSSKKGSWRVMVPDRKISFIDRIAGPQSFNPALECGDFIVRRKDGAWAYQLAVVVDDALMGVTEVVRGEDLLLSTAQQIYLYEVLFLSDGFRLPEYAHFPLIRNEQGERLSKRDKSCSLEYLFAHHTPQEIIGRAAYLTGLRPTAEPIMPCDLLNDH